jgi:hypothetical protein
MKDVEDAARALGLQLHTLNAINEREIHAAFAALGKLRPAALLVGSIAGASNSPRWLPTTPFRQSMKRASTPRPAA